MGFIARQLYMRNPASQQDTLKAAADSDIIASGAASDGSTIPIRVVFEQPTSIYSTSASTR